jgi:5-deoxy-glucuronate isomerase
MTEGYGAHNEFQLLGGERVFASVTDLAQTPRNARTLIASGAGYRFALAGAKCGRRLPARYGPAPEVHLASADNTDNPGGHR